MEVFHVKLFSLNCRAKVQDSIFPQEEESSEGRSYAKAAALSPSFRMRGRGERGIIAALSNRPIL